jgi:hypothetical protein
LLIFAFDIALARASLAEVRISSVTAERDLTGLGHDQTNNYLCQNGKKES